MALKDVLIDELRDMYSAENQQVKALPKLAKGAKSGVLRFTKPHPNAGLCPRQQAGTELKPIRAMRNERALAQLPHLGTAVTPHERG